VLLLCCAWSPAQQADSKDAKQEHVTAEQKHNDKSPQQQNKKEDKQQVNQQEKPQARSQQPKQSSQGDETNSSNDVQIAAGDIRLSSGTVLHADQLHVTSISRLGESGCKEQTIQIHSGRLSLTDAGLTRLINHGFEQKGDSKRVKITADGDKLKFEGSKAAGMSMTFEAKPAALGDSRIELVSTDVKMEHLPVKGLMHVFGLNMDDLMHPKNPALSVEKDNLIVDLRYVGKTTHLEGEVKSVAIQGHRIVLTFGGPASPRNRVLAQAGGNKLPAKLKAKKSH
jgi:hypothetical protein